MSCPLRANRAVAGLSSKDACPIVTHLVASPDSCKIAAGLTNGAVRIFNASSLQLIVAVNVSRDNFEVQCIAWRGNAELMVAVGRVDNNGTPVGRPLLCHINAASGAIIHSEALDTLISAVAVSSDGCLLAYAVGSTIRFMDMRVGLAQAKELAQYRDSHSDLITLLAFHPLLTNYLYSGSEDGLVCVFDTRIAGEQDAILSVLSAGSGVTACGTFGPHGGFAYIVTATGGLSLWNLGTAEPIAEFPTLPFRLSESGRQCHYVVDCAFDEANNSLHALVGDDDGRMAWLDVTPTDVKPAGQLTGGHTATVRCSATIPLRDTTTGACGLCVFTGGEDGVVQQWATEAVHGLVYSKPGASGRPGVEVRPSSFSRRVAVGVAGAASGDHVQAFGSQEAPMRDGKE